MTPAALVLLLANILVLASTSAGDDILIADFEGDDFGGWQVSGEAFGKGPAKGTLPNQMHVDGFMGQGLVNSFYGGDGTTGTLTSTEFTIERSYINFLIGGGEHAEKTCMNLLVDGTVARTATGPNTVPGGSERLRWQSWNVAEFIGQKAIIQIVDNHTGGWGHINVDHIMQSNEKASSERTREIIVEKRFLNLPVQNGAPKTWIRLLDGDKILREFDIELADSQEETDFWVTVDLLEFMEFREVKITLWADNLMPHSQGFDMITQAEGIIGGEDLYKEQYRPQFHFSPKRGWMNDPNGLVYYDGEYHLFFQHNPYGWNWGNMTWGHAVSKDLVRWEELGDAIHPDEHGTIFSGSAVVDWPNSTGFKFGDAPPMVCIFTYAGGTNLSSKDAKFTQGVALSNDRGRTWEKYGANPVQGHIIGGNRDPKVIWHAPTNQWVIVLFLDEKRVAFFTSKNLTEWTLASEMDALFECPELFELPVDGEMKWILYGASGEYYIGEFDGKAYTPDGKAIPFNYGDCFYASQTFNDIPPEDGRRIQIAWGRSGHKDMPFNQMMNFPVELTLHNTPDGQRMFAWPVREITILYKETHTWKDTTVEEANNALQDIKGDLFDITVVFETDDTGKFGIAVNGLSLRYDARRQQIRCKDKKAELKSENGKVALRLLVDRLSVEIFGNNGLLYMPMSHICENKDARIEILSRKGEIRIAELTVHELNSAW